MFDQHFHHFSIEVGFEQFTVGTVRQVLAPTVATVHTVASAGMVFTQLMRAVLGVL